MPALPVETAKRGPPQGGGPYSSPKVEVTTYLTIALESQNART